MTRFAVGGDVWNPGMARFLGLAAKLACARRVRVRQRFPKSSGVYFSEQVTDPFFILGHRGVEVSAAYWPVWLRMQSSFIERRSARPSPCARYFVAVSGRLECVAIINEARLQDLVSRRSGGDMRGRQFEIRTRLRAAGLAAFAQSSRSASCRGFQIVNFGHQIER